MLKVFLPCYFFLVSWTTSNCMIAEAPVSVEESQRRSRKHKQKADRIPVFNGSMNFKIAMWSLGYVMVIEVYTATGKDIPAFPNLRPCIFATYLYQCQCFYATQLSCARELAAYFLKKIQQELVQCKAAGALLPTQRGSGNMRLAVGRTAAV